MELIGRKILIVDDDPGFVKMVDRILRIHELQISIALDGNTAIEKVLSEPPELVLLDLKLPDITGEEVLRKIKEINEDISIIVVTGFGGEQIAVNLMKAGAVDFISKPFENEVLFNAIKNGLQLHDIQIEEKKSKDKNFSPLERFFPFLAHEIRNPLHAIGGALAIIQRRSDVKDEFLAKSIKIIQEEVHHLNEFVQECLNFVRPPMKSQFNEFEVKEIISVVVEIISHMFENLSKTIRITIKMDSQIPKVYANYEEIKSAFLNIVKNAFEAMGGGGELIIRARFKSDPNPGHIEVVFTDSGYGIKEEVLKNLFSPFITTKLGGTGLGLAICQRIIVERHRGKIRIESEEGKGTTVIVELPVKQTMGVSGDKIVR